MKRETAAIVIIILISIVLFGCIEFPKLDHQRLFTVDTKPDYNLSFTVGYAYKDSNTISSKFTVDNQGNETWTSIKNGKEEVRATAKVSKVQLNELARTISQSNFFTIKQEDIPTITGISKSDDGLRITITVTLDERTHTIRGIGSNVKYYCYRPDLNVQILCQIEQASSSWNPGPY